MAMQEAHYAIQHALQHDSQQLMQWGLTGAGPSYRSWAGTRSSALTGWNNNWLRSNAN